MVSVSHAGINSCTLNHGAPWTVRKSIWECSVALNPSYKLWLLIRVNPCVSMHLKMQQWILRVNGHTVKVLLSLTITTILAQIWELISMMWQNIRSIASTRCRILLHLTWVRVTVLTLTPLLWCYTTSPSGQSVYFCIKNEIKHYKTFLPAWSKAWTFTTASRACRRCFCVSFVGVLRGQQIA